MENAEIAENTALEILNEFRNEHYADPSSTETSRIANALNEILPKYTKSENSEETEGVWTPVLYNVHDSSGAKSTETMFVCSKCKHVARSEPYGLRFCPYCGNPMQEKLGTIGAREEQFRLIMSQLLAMLPEEPCREIGDEPGFWTNGDMILCPSEKEADAVAAFLQDIADEYSYGADFQVGYFDPAEDSRSGETDECTGFWYVDWDTATAFTKNSKRNKKFLKGTSNNTVPFMII